MILISWGGGGRYVPLIKLTVLPLQKQACSIKPDRISIYVDNEDQKHHSLLTTAQLQVTVTTGEQSPIKADLKINEIECYPKKEVVPSIDSKTNSTAIFSPKFSGRILMFTKVLVSFLPESSVDLKDIEKAVILEEQILCDHIKVKEGQHSKFKD